MTITMTTPMHPKLKTLRVCVNGVMACAAAAWLAGCGGGAASTSVAGSTVTAAVPTVPSPAPSPSPAPVVVDPTPAVVIPAPAGVSVASYSAASAGMVQDLNSGSLVVTPDGSAWFGGGLAPNAIGRMTPAGVVSYPVTGAAASGSVSIGPLMLAADGKIWFCEPTGGSALQGAILRIDPATGLSTRYQPPGPIPSTGTAAPSGITAGAQAYAIAQSADGKFWFSEYNGARIGLFDPVLDTAVEYGPLQSRATFLATGPDGAVWFSESLSATTSILGRIDTYLVTTTTGGVTTTTTQVRITEFSDHPIAGTIAGIAAGADGKLWFIKNGFNGSAIGKMDPATGNVTLYTGLTGALAQLGAIVAGPDGQIWFTDYAQGLIGRVTAAGAITEFSSGATDRFFNTIAAGRATDALHRVWFTRPGDDQLGEISLP